MAAVSKSSNYPGHNSQAVRPSQSNPARKPSYHSVKNTATPGRPATAAKPLRVSNSSGASRAAGHRNQPGAKHG